MKSGIEKLQALYVGEEFVKPPRTNIAYLVEIFQIRPY
jgi:hypothetical protein